MKRISVNKATIIFASVIATIVALFMFTLHLHNKQQAAEQAEFDKIWDDMVDDNSDVLAPDWYNYIDTVQVECNCFNCTNHESGYVPPITPEQLNANANLFGIDNPEEMYGFGDTIALRNHNHNNLLVIHYHSKYGKEYYDGWDIYIYSLVGE
jgi:hypothetical protein